MRSTRSIEKARLALDSIPSDPLVCRGSADTELLGDVGGGPTFPENTSDDQSATEDGQFRPRMCHESPPSAWRLEHPKPKSRTLVLSTTCSDSI